MIFMLDFNVDNNVSTRETVMILGLWDVRDVVNLRCPMFGMWDV